MNMLNSLNKYKDKVIHLALSFCLFVVLIVSAILNGNRFAPALVSALCLFAYYALILLLLFKSGFLGIFNLINKKRVYIFIALLIVLAVPLYLYIDQSKVIRYWDNGMYWYSVLDFVPALNNSVRVALNDVYQSILNSDYNLLPSLLIALPAMTVKSYSGFIVINYVFFCVPTLVLMSCFLFKVAYMAGFKNNRSLIPFVAALVFSPILIPVLLGFIDICVVLPLLSLFAVATGASFLKKNKLLSLLIGITTVLIVLLRRYFAYAIIGFYLYLILNNLWSFIRQYNVSNTLPSDALLNFCLNSVFCLGTVCILFFSVLREFFERSFFNNYSTSYAAYYMYKGLSDRVYGYFVSIGPVFVITVLIGMAVLICKFIKSRSFDFSISIIYIDFVCAFLATLFSFLRVQDFSVQHFYVIDVPVFILFGLSLYVVIDSKITKSILVSFSLVTLMNNFGLVALPAQYSVFFGKTQYQTKVRHDLDSIHKLDSDLETLNSKTDGLTYINASSNTLNQALIMRSYAPNSLVTPFRLSDPCDIDLRDGFQYGFLDATFVVSCTKAQTHVADASNQSVVLYLTDMFNKESYISRHFKFLKSYRLDNGVKANLFEKVSDFTKDDLLKMKSHFKSLYPNSDDLFANRFDAYISYHKLQ